MKTRWQTPTTSCNIHHHLLLAVWTRQEKNIVKLNNVIKSFLNPMTRDDEEMINIITKPTKVVMLPQVKKYMCSRDEIDQQKYTAFDDERVNTTEVNLWARVKLLSESF